MRNENNLSLWWDRVLIMLPDGPGSPKLSLATIEHGAVRLPLDPLLPAHDIEVVAAEAGARLVLARWIGSCARRAGRPATTIDRWIMEPWAAALRLR